MRTNMGGSVEEASFGCVSRDRLGLRGIPYRYHPRRCEKASQEARRGSGRPDGPSAHTGWHKAELLQPQGMPKSTHQSIPLTSSHLAWHYGQARHGARPTAFDSRPWTPQGDCRATEWLQRHDILVSVQITRDAVDTVAHAKAAAPEPEARRRVLPGFEPMVA